MKIYYNNYSNKSLQNEVQKLPLLPRKEQSREVEEQWGQGGFQKQTRTQAKCNYQVQDSACYQKEVQKLPLLPAKEQSRESEEQRGQGGFQKQTQIQRKLLPISRFHF